MASKYYLSVKQALDMTKDILASRQNLESLVNNHNKWSNAVYPSKPDPPKLKVEPDPELPEAPKIKPNLKRAFGVYLLIILVGLAMPMKSLTKAFLLMFAIWAVPIGQLIVYSIKKKSKIKNYRNTPEYQEEYRKRIAERYERQKANEEQHKRDMEEYETKTLPEWETGEPAWLEKKEYKMKFFADAINTAYDSLNAKISELDSFYRRVGIVPVGYRDPDTLEDLCRILESSSYDVKSAIELLDRNRQMSMIAEQNDYLAQQTAIAEKTMREARLHYVASAVQHHNTNKQLKQINEKMNK